MTRVVPLTGDVDRNGMHRAHKSWMVTVVPLTGDVDRNLFVVSPLFPLRASSPSRGTWIEIHTLPLCWRRTVVVPLTGDVDRNDVPVLAAAVGGVVPLTGDVARNVNGNG